MTRYALTGVLCAALSVAAGAQAPPQPPKPGPEHQRLAAFVGTWTFEGEMKPGPMGPGGKMTGNDRIQWLPGNFFIERRYDGKSPMGEMKGLEILGYDAAKKTYTFNGFDNMGMSGSGTLTVSGNTWTTQGTGNMAGMVFHDRCTLAFAEGLKTLNIKCEMSQDGKKWAPSFEGKATKVK